MRAVKKLNHNIKHTGSNFSTYKTLNYSDALNFLAMAGIFDESNVDALATIAHGGALSREELQKATEQIIDSSIEFILSYPDLEYTENTTNMLSLYKTCQVNFIERVLKEKAIGESVTPRIANKSSDNIEMA